MCNSTNHSPNSAENDAEKQLTQLIDHVLACKKYDLTDAHLAAIFALQSRLEKLPGPNSAISHWLAACRHELESHRRAQQFIEQMLAAANVDSGSEALDLISKTLTAVEDAQTDIPNQPENWQTDGRMYPRRKFRPVRLMAAVT